MATKSPNLRREPRASIPVSRQLAPRKVKPNPDADVAIMAEAREQARQKALAGIKAAGEAGDWRAWEAFLRMSFPADYRRDTSVNVNASATAQQAGIVRDEAMRAADCAAREAPCRNHI